MRLFLPIITLVLAAKVKHSAILDQYDQALANLDANLVKMQEVFGDEVNYILTNQQPSYFALISLPSNKEKALAGDISSLYQIVETFVVYHAAGRYWLNPNTVSLISMDEVIRTLTSTVSLFFSRCTSETNSVSMLKLLELEERNTNVRSWIRIILSTIDNLEIDKSSTNYDAEVRSFRGRTTDISGGIWEATVRLEELLIMLLKIQYQISLHASRNSLPAHNGGNRLFAHSRTCAIWATNYAAHLSAAGSTPIVIIRKAFQLLMGSDFVKDLWNLITGVDANYSFDPSMILFLRHNAVFLAKECPEARGRLEALVGNGLAQQLELIAKEEKAKRQKEKKKQAKKKKRTQAKNPAPAIDYDTEDEENQEEECADSFPEVKPGDWKPTQSWMVMAKVYLAEYCRHNLLIPLRTQRYPDEVPSDFTWDTLLSDASEEVKFCINVTQDRNRTVKSNEILRFLPSDELISSTMASRFELDQKALRLLLTFATSDARVKENLEVAPHFFWSNNITLTSLIFLGMHRACERLRLAALENESISTLCQQIKTVRRSFAHPRVNRRLFDLIKSEYLNN